MSPTSSIVRLLPTHSRGARSFAALAAALALAAAAPLAAAQFTVDSAGDAPDANFGDSFCATAGAACTLRAAIQEANALEGPDSIVFASGLNGTPITLGSGLPTLNSELTITGNGTTQTIVEASTCNPVTLPGGCTPAEWRVFFVDWLAIAKLANLTARHGRCSGDCDFTSEGAGIFNRGLLSLHGVTVSANHAESSSGGGIANNPGTILSIRDSTISGNRAAVGGGGLDNHDPDGAIGSIVRTLFSDNEAPSGGALHAGIIETIAHSTFSGNSADLGAGIFADRDLALVTDCTFTGNTATSSGGAIHVDRPDAIGAITRSLFSGNSAENGGGLSVVDPMGSISNSTFSGNTASVRGGAIDAATGALASIAHVTFHGNSSPLGAAIYGESSPTISNSILGANGTGANCAGTIDDAGGNRSDDSSCNSGGSIVPGTDYSATLADNGGNTATHALPGGSPAIDDFGACPVGIGGVDQRGAPRDGSCDGGAFEVVAGFVFADDFELGSDARWTVAVP